MSDIFINKQIIIPLSEIKFDFFRSSGPGGQHVNKVETGVRLRFNVVGSPSIPENTKTKLLVNHPKKINRDGELLIESIAFKSQHRNKQEVINKFVALVKETSKKTKNRIKTLPTKASNERRISKKKKRSELKNLRKSIKTDDF